MSIEELLKENRFLLIERNQQRFELEMINRYNVLLDNVFEISTQINDSGKGVLKLLNVVNELLVREKQLLAEVSALRTELNHLKG